jgi:hypothetical protein
MSKAASEALLAALHIQVAEVLKSRLGNAELCTAADVNAAIKFLKDNNITCAPDKNNHLGELEEELQAAKDRGDELGANDADLQAALDAIPFMGAPN